MKEPSVYMTQGGRGDILSISLSFPFFFPLFFFSKGGIVVTPPTTQLEDHLHPQSISQERLPFPSFFSGGPPATQVESNVVCEGPDHRPGSRVRPLPPLPFPFLLRQIGTRPASRRSERRKLFYLRSGAYPLVSFSLFPPAYRAPGQGAADGIAV